MRPLDRPLFILYAAKDFLEKGTAAAAKDFKTDSNLPKQFDSLVHARLCMPVVNIIFSLELTIKGLLKYEGKTFPPVHDLSKLFTILDQTIIDQIIAHYRSHDHYKNYVCIRLFSGDRDTPFEATSIPLLPKDISGVTALIASHGTYFVEFRYLFELEDTKELIVRFRELANLAFSAITVLGKNLNKTVILTSIPASMR